MCLKQWIIHRNRINRAVVWPVRHYHLLFWVETTLGSVPGDAAGPAVDIQSTAIHYRYSERRFKIYCIFDPFPLSIKLLNHRLVLRKICKKPSPHNAVNHFSCQETNLHQNTEIGATCLQIVGLLCYFVWLYEVNLTSKRIWISR